MAHLLGEYDCKLDAKGRMVLPAQLKRQLPDAERTGLVVNRGFEKNLTIYTREEWDKITKKLAALNPYKAANRQFIREFNRGATELMLDSANRVLLPKSLLEYAGIDNDVVLVCQLKKIEAWSRTEYNKLFENGTSEGFAALAENVMGGDDMGGFDDE